MAISFDKSLSLHAQALQLRGQRAKVIATNIANANTPNYLARDLDFKAVLANSSQASTQVPLATSNARHLQAYGSTAGQLRYRAVNQPSIDGNTVDEHQEKTAFADNALRYQASLQFLNSRIKRFMDVLQSE